MANRRSCCRNAWGSGVERVVGTGVDRVLERAGQAIVVVDAALADAAVVGKDFPVGVLAEEVKSALQTERVIAVGVLADRIAGAQRGEAVVQSAVHAEGVERVTCRDGRVGVYRRRSVHALALRVRRDGAEEERGVVRQLVVRVHEQRVTRQRGLVGRCRAVIEATSRGAGTDAVFKRVAVGDTHQAGGRAEEVGR
ncbi:hypothetical protein D3C81_1536480 [compost metagenome]